MVHAILDEALVCHLGFVHEGQPFVLPTTYARIGDVLYVHGSAASRMVKVLAAGVSLPDLMMREDNYRKRHAGHERCYQKQLFHT